MTRPLKRPMRVALADDYRGLNPYASSPAEFSSRTGICSKRCLKMRPPTVPNAPSGFDSGTLSEICECPQILGQLDLQIGG